MTDWWSYPTNYSTNKSVDGVYGFLFDYPSFILGNWYAYGIIILIWCTFFGLGLAMGSRKALAYSSFIAFIFAVYLSARELLNPIIPIFLIIIVIIGVIAGKEENSL